MLCKASAMCDYSSFDAIARSSAPRKAKALGRSVGPWNQRIWDGVVCEVAREVVLQKFAALPELSAVLLGTGTRVLAEMTRNDSNWGTGVDMGQGADAKPSKWRGALLA